MSGRRAHGDFTENLEAVARGVRRLEQIQDPILREAVAAALRLSERDLRPDPASRVRMRNTVLAALEPAKPTTSDRVYGIFALIGMPAPMIVRALVVVLIIAGVLGGATVASQLQCTVRAVRESRWKRRGSRRFSRSFIVSRRISVLSPV